MKLVGGLFLIVASVALTLWRLQDYRDNFLSTLAEDLQDYVVGMPWFVTILLIFVLGIALIFLELY